MNGIIIKLSSGPIWLLADDGAENLANTKNCISTLPLRRIELSAWIRETAVAWEFSNVTSARWDSPPVACGDSPHVRGGWVCERVGG